MTLKKADWPAVEKLCLETLQKRSKDLQIAAWLVEAWLRLYGLPGVRDGFAVLDALSSQFWDTIHPLPDEGDMEYRVAPFEWANEKLPVLLKLVPLSNPKGDKSRPVTLADWDNSRRPKAQDDYRSREPVSAQMTPEVFQESVTLTSTPDLTALLEIVDGAISALSGLDTTLDAKCGSHAPGLGQISSVLSSIRGLVHTARVQRPEPLKTSDPESPMSSAPEELNSGDGGGPIRTRVEAYRRLTEAADFLARTEPHSPVPYLVRRAIGWGSMTLDDLLPQLVRNNSELSEIYRLLQIGKMEME
jgi:type VI secretion system protein ImpA